MNQYKENTCSRTIFRSNVILSLALVLVMCFSLSANAIQIIEHTNLQTGKSSITVGITDPQLILGPIDGFFINLLLFPFLGPLPEITLFEFNLAGAPIIDPDGQHAQWNFNDAIVDPAEITAALLIDFDPSIPVGTVATYELSSLGLNGQVLETLTVESTVIPEPSTFLLFLIPMVLMLLKTYFVKSGHTIFSRRIIA